MWFLFPHFSGGSLTPLCFLFFKILENFSPHSLHCLKKRIKIASYSLSVLWTFQQMTWRKTEDNRLAASRVRHSRVWGDLNVLASLGVPRTYSHSHSWVWVRVQQLDSARQVSIIPQTHTHTLTHLWWVSTRTIQYRVLCIEIDII